MACTIGRGTRWCCRLTLQATSPTSPHASLRLLDLKLQPVTLSSNSTSVVSAQQRTKSASLSNMSFESVLAQDMGFNTLMTGELDYNEMVFQNFAFAGLCGEMYCVAPTWLLSQLCGGVNSTTIPKTSNAICSWATNFVHVLCHPASPLV